MSVEQAVRGYIKEMNQRRSFHTSEAYLVELVSMGFE